VTWQISKSQKKDIIYVQHNFDFSLLHICLDIFVGCPGPSKLVGVVGGDANSKLVDALSKEYGLVRAKVFKDINLDDARRALQSKEIGAVLVVIPLSEKYLALVRGYFSRVQKYRRC
jgi:hypothetical protein